MLIILAHFTATKLLMNTNDNNFRPIKRKKNPPHLNVESYFSSDLFSIIYITLFYFNADFSSIA